MNTMAQAIADMAHDLATYQIGETAPRFIPNEQEPRFMVHIVAYDITEPKRLRLVAKTCEDYGYRIEKSVFECDLTEEKFRDFWAALNRIIDQDEDALIAYRVCKSCVREIHSAGVVERSSMPLVYIF